MATVHLNKRSRCLLWDARQSSSPREKTLRLDRLSLQALTKHVGKLPGDIGRNIRKKKALREYFSYSLPVSLQTRLLEEAVENSEDADIIMSLLFMFIPFQKLPVQNVDLLGKLRYAINLEIDDLNMKPDARWHPFYPLQPLTASKLTNLYETLSWAIKSIEKLEGISFAAEADALKKTNLPHILARAHSLTRVVILEGADNHTLRIIGLNCPSLKHLDVSHSWSVTDAGLKNLLLKRPPQRQPNRISRRVMSTLFSNLPALRGGFGSDHLKQKNVCSASLDVLVLTGTQVTWEGCEFACLCMPESYLHTVRPLIKVSRMKIERETVASIFVVQQIDRVFRAMALSLAVSGHTNVNVPIYKPRPPTGSGIIANQPDPEESPRVVHAFDRGTSFVCLSLKLEGLQVTALDLPFYSLNLHYLFPVPLRTLADEFPNLVYFRGCLRGTLIEDPLIDRQMIHLKKVKAWAAYSNPLISILRHCSSLTNLEYNHLDIWDRQGFDLDAFLHGVIAPNLSHVELNRSFQYNPGLQENLEEITLRPARNLGPASLSLCVERCRNLRRIGDLQTWNLTEADIKRLSTELKVNGRDPPTFCVFGTPPSDESAKEWDSWMPLE